MLSSEEKIGKKSNFNFMKVDAFDNNIFKKYANF